MAQTARLAAVLIAVSLLLCGARQLIAADPPATTGTMSGTVTGTNGKPAANVPVQLVLTTDLTKYVNSLGGGKNTNTPKKKSFDGIAAEELKAATKTPAKTDPKKPAKEMKLPILKETKTGDKGEYTFNDVLPDDYVVLAGTRGSDFGYTERAVRAGEKAKVVVRLLPNNDLPRPK